MCREWEKQGKSLLRMTVTHGRKTLPAGLFSTDYPVEIAAKQSSR